MGDFCTHSKGWVKCFITLVRGLINRAGLHFLCVFTHGFGDASKHFKEQFLQRLDLPSTSNHCWHHGRLPFVTSSEDGRLWKGQVLFVSHGLQSLTLTFQWFIAWTAPHWHYMAEQQFASKRSWLARLCCTPCRQPFPHSRWFTTQPKYDKPGTSSGSSCLRFSAGKTLADDHWGCLPPRRAAGWVLQPHTMLAHIFPFQHVPVTVCSNTTLSFPSFPIIPKGEILDKMRWPS